ncbi:Fic family protein [Candidatus Peregrinibacteria bacterium]|nr:Fic family protein [Candidatus Peregrinibacteria bacterium]
MFFPKFHITSSILNNLSRIDVLREKILTCPIHPKEEYKLKREAILSMVHNSTAIEGNMLNEREVQKVLEGKKINANSRDIYEVQNYKKSLAFISLRKSSEITERDILKIHKLTTANVLPKEKCGIYRKEPVYVVRRTPLTQEVLYIAPDHSKVPRLVRDLCEWINTSRKEKLSPVLIAGIAHAEMAAIHPFSDGNGRTARLLATLILYTEKYDFRKLFALENYYNSERQKYYKAIHLGKNYAERSKGSMTPWLEYFVKGFLSEMEVVLDKIRPFLYFKKAPKERVILSKKEIQILDFLNEMGNITSSDVQDILTVTKRTAQRFLKKLIEKKLVAKRGSKKNAMYVLV